jgi:HK97 family phage prohead protease
MEYREFRAESVETDDTGSLRGLVTPFDRETTIGDLKRGGWREDVAKGTFAKTLREGDPLMVYQHDLTKPLARKSAGNLDLREGSYKGSQGLVVDAQPVDTSYARDLRALVDAKVIRGMSFGFEVVKDEWRDDDGNPSDKYNGTQRTLREVRLIEVSPVTRPAYEGTMISSRDEASALLEQRAGNKPYGNVKYADPKNGKYPIDTEEHVRAALAYINMPKNAAKYPMNGVSLSSVKSAIEAAAKKFGIKVSKNAEVEPDEVRDEYEDEFYENEDVEPEVSQGDEPREQEPETSTPEETDDFALFVAATAQQHSRELGSL